MGCGTSTPAPEQLAGGGQDVQRNSERDVRFRDDGAGGVYTESVDASASSFESEGAEPTHSKSAPQILTEEDYGRKSIDWARGEMSREDSNSSHQKGHISRNWKSAKQLVSQKSYIPLDELYCFESHMGDALSNASEIFDEEESKLLEEAAAAGLEYTDPVHAKEVLFSSVSLSLLIDLAQKVDDESLSTYAVVETIIKPSSAKEQTSYASLLEPEQVGRPHFFVCHSWGAKFMEMVRRVQNDLRVEDPDNVFLWLDMFAFNYHMKDRGHFSRAQDALKLAKRGTLVVLEPTFLLASCCLYELWSTVYHRGLQFLTFVHGNPAPQIEWEDAVSELDIFACKPTKQRDRGVTFKAVSDCPGVEGLNQQLRVLLSLRPPHYQPVELDMNSEFTQYVELGVLDDWVKSTPKLGKTLWIRGANGTGKTTVYSAILEKAELHQPAANTTAGNNKRYKYNGAAVIAHAVCHNDTQTRIPTKIAASMAWQLYQAFPDLLGEYYSNLDLESALHDLDITDAVNQLLRIPIQEHIGDAHRIMIVLDGLDEGTGDVCSLTSAGMSNYDDQMLTDINLCWENPVLRFACIHLRTLPKNVSLVVTSRSSDLAIGQQDYLEHMLDSFGIESMTVEPVDMFFMLEDNNSTGMRPDLSNSGPLGHLSVKLRSDMTKKESGFSRAYSSYSQPASEMNDTHAEHQSRMAWNQSFPTMVYARLAHTLEAAGVTASTHVPEAMKACLAWHCEKALSNNGTQRLVRLLEVLAAIREPPTIPQLRTWGFKDAKRLVKACGFLLHTTPSGHVHAFHKILFKFLADRRQAKEFFASPRSGHKSLARMLAHNINDRESVTTEYALRNVMLHAHLADDNAMIDTLAGDIHFWEKCFVAGVGHLVLQDLLRFGRFSATLQDAVIFLSAHHKEFIKSPDLVVQRAYDTPRMSLFSKQLRKQKVKVPGRVLSKPIMWSPEQFSVTNPDGVIWCVELSPDGIIMALGTGDHKVVLCEARSGMYLAALEGHTEAVMTVKYSPDGRRIASGSCDGTVRLWDAGGGVRIATLRGHNGPVTSCSFSPSGRYLVSGGIDTTVVVWDVEGNDGVKVAELKGHKRWVSSVEYGPYGNIIVSAGNDGCVLVWDAVTFELRNTVREGPDPVYSVAINSDESLIAYGCGDSTVCIWNLQEMKEAEKMHGHNDRVDCVAFNVDGTLVASCSRDARICIFQTRSGKLMTNMDGHRGAVHHIRFSPLGNRVYSGSADKTAKVWSLPPATELGGSRVAINERLNHHFGAVRSLSFGPTNSMLASGSEDTLVKIWDADKEQMRGCCEGHLGPVFCVAVSPDGSRVVSGAHDNSVRIWDTATGEECGIFKGHDMRVHDVAYSPDGSIVASASYDMTVAIWDSGTGVESGRLRGHGGSVTSLAFSCDGSLIVTGSVDLSLKLWDVATMKEIAAVPDHPGHVTCVAASPDGKHLCSGSHLGLIQLWSFDNLKRGLTLREASEEKQRTEKQEGTVRVEIEDADLILQTLCVAFSRDGRLLAAALEDTLVRVFETKNGKEVAVFKGHNENVRSLAFSPDGQLLASGADDQFVRLWEIGHLTPESSNRGIRENA